METLQIVKLVTLSLKKKGYRNSPPLTLRHMFICVFRLYRKGFDVASKDFEPQDLNVSVVGRSFMITGANSGIGRATAMAVAKRGEWV